MSGFDFNAVRRSSWWRRSRRWTKSALFTAIDRLAPHVRGLYSAVGLFLLVGLAIALVAVWAFATLAEAVMEGETRRLDTAVLLWISQHTSRTLDIAALEVTALANTLVIAVVVIVAGGFLWFTRHREAVFLLGAAVIGNAVLLQVLKPVFGRTRPEAVVWRAEYAGGQSFPSGHAMTAMVVYATLAYLVVRLTPSRAARSFTALVAAGIILLVGLSRLYLGVHYPTDVLAGYAVGFAWAAFSAFGLKLFAHLRGGIGGAGSKARPPASRS